MNRRTKEELAFTLIEILVVVATTALLAVVLLPARAATRSDVDRITCVRNLKVVGMAFRTWANAHNDRFPMQVPDGEGGASNSVPLSGATAPRVWHVFQVISNELETPKVCVCPADYRVGRSNFLSANSGPTIRDFWSNEAVSFFIGVDADQTRPQMFLSGDRNIGTATTHSSSAYGYSPTTSFGAAVSLGNDSTNLQWTLKLHQAQGNVALADGSVQQFSSFRLREATRFTGDTSGRKYTLLPGTTPGKGNNLIIP